MMARALIIADLEGVAGVDDLASLVAGTPSYARACELIGAELAVVTRALTAAGWNAIRVSDSHRAGAPTPNVRLAQPIETVFADDAFATTLFRDVGALVCLGMHAAAATRGFAAHTFHVHCAWELDGRALSETDVALGLAAEAGVPVLFVSGDDVLAQSMRHVPFVVSKRAVSAACAASLDGRHVQAELARAASLRPVPTPPLPGGPISVRFKSRWQAELAVASGATRVDECLVRVTGQTLRERYDAARAAMRAAAEPLGRAVRRLPATGRAEDVAGLLLRSFDRAVPNAYPEAAHATLRGFRALTDVAEPWALALRALTLHMLQAHQPRFFAQAALGPVLDAAMRPLAQMPTTFPATLERNEAMARLDALYLRHERGEPIGDVDVHPFLRAIPPDRRTYRWLFGALVEQLGLGRAPPSAPRIWNAHEATEDLYRLTHEFFLATRYLHRPLPARGFEAATEELLLRTPTVLERQNMDLAGEIAVCLRVAGEHQSREHQMLLVALDEHRAGDGTINDPAAARAGQRAPAEGRRIRAHVCATALIAFAGSLA